MKVTILGGGAYGIALSLMFHKNNCNITIWEKFEEAAKNLKKTRENAKVLPGIKIPKDIKVTSNLGASIKDAELIVFAVPAGFVDNVSKDLKEFYQKNQHICIASKGIEQGTCRFVEEVVSHNIKTRNIAVISGGAFAIDIANNNPVGLMVAAKNSKTRDIVRKYLANDTLKLRISRDIIGTEICGAVKNVIAIASGMVAGMKLSESTQTMLITESLHDIKQLSRALGGRGRTVLSFAGFGDILLTCTSTKSRNFTYGKMLGEGVSRKKIEEYAAATTVEGLYTLKSIYKLINKKKVDIPIINLIYDIVFKNESPEKIKEFLVIKG